MKFVTTLLLGAVALAGLYSIGGLDILADKEGVTSNGNTSINGNASIIEQISTGLGSAIRIEGKETAFFTLKRRMAHYNIQAVSMAFMENHKMLRKLPCKIKKHYFFYSGYLSSKELTNRGFSLLAVPYYIWK